MMVNCVILLITTTGLVFSLSVKDELVITLPGGQIQGSLYLTPNPNSRTYYGFRGIPYAKPPLGDLRFEAPQPPEPWSNILDASQDSKACISINHFTSPDSESEDCLYINVYTPSLKPLTKLPVLFWIHGGAFTMGSSSKSIYGPDFLVQEDVILVTHNYRLGPFGFLSTEDRAIPGNAGLKDQNLALQWTHDNIALFGGDPDKITIFGQSAGATSVGHHIVSKKSAGLFRAGIVESGSAVITRAIRFEPKSYAFLLGGAIPGGDYGNDTQKLKQFLLGQTVDTLINATNSLPASQQVAPVIEVEGEDAFLTESPYELLKSGRFNQVPIMIGICAEESLMFLKDLQTAEQMALSYDLIPSSIIPTNLRPNTSDEGAIIEKIKNIYLKGSKRFATDLVGLAEYYSDNRYTRGIIKHAELSSNYVPVYLYQFAYYGRPITQPFIEGAEKAAHTAELPFLFLMMAHYDADAANLLTQNRIVKMWTNFAKFFVLPAITIFLKCRGIPESISPKMKCWGFNIYLRQKWVKKYQENTTIAGSKLNPTPEKLELLNNITWPTITATNQQFLNINGTLEVRTNLREKSYPKWNEIFKDYGTKPFVTY